MKLHYRNLVPNSYVSLLISLLLLVLLTPFADLVVGGHIGVSLVILYLTVSAALVVSPSKMAKVRVMIIAALGSILWTCSKSIPYEPFHTTAFQCLANGIIILFLAVSAWLILKHILYSEASHNTICGAICVYLMIGVVFALLYLTCLEVSPDSIFFSHRPHITFNERERLAQLIYFSMCTLTTNGYGDILPDARFTRTLAWVEATTGQLYIAIMVARLVGLQIASAAVTRANAEQIESQNALAEGEISEKTPAN